ncbi:hypothetical protein [Methylobacter sp. YRD-M1]|uniref:hypothetical protein n=1 Tax=Methylobacter sp. YRD-M1 TaxID=2911520 RepID=UPI00227B0BB6|nr:hypothetical protein [Methylobacter sp. YRD-M1]WAK01202.1 hypothetical protein LZ558_15390 [Methylobacter sp. YRD-M1]
MVEFNLRPADFYFLDLIPLIEIIWADGDNQPGELRILYNFLIEHIAFLDRIAGIQVVSPKDADAFLDRFAHNRPSPRLLTELRSIVFKAVPAHRHSSIFEYCLDIAAACTTRYPFGLRDRIIDEEKKLLTKIFAELNIKPDTILPDQV